MIAPETRVVEPRLDSLLASPNDRAGTMHVVASSISEVLWLTCCLHVIYVYDDMSNAEIEQVMYDE